MVSKLQEMMFRDGLFSRHRLRWVLAKKTCVCNIVLPKSLLCASRIFEKMVNEQRRK